MTEIRCDESENWYRVFVGSERRYRCAKCGFEVSAETFGTPIACSHFRPVSVSPTEEQSNG